MDDRMDDELMLSAWRKPRADFSKGLRARLDRLESESAPARRPKPVMRWLAYAASVLVAVGLFTVPSVRAGAKAFLDLFRVVNFAPVAVSPEGLKKLAAGGESLNLQNLLGGKVEVLKEPGEPRKVASIAEASELAGLRVRTPAWMPPGLAQREQIGVTGEQALRVNLDVATLEQIMNAVGVDDLRVPEGIDGQSMTLRVPPVVHIAYSDGQADRPRTVSVVQARRPEATLPAGTDLSTLAEIALRILGVEPTEAHRFAQNVDWRTTLIVPVPTELASFRQVDVQGNAALLIETKAKKVGERYLRPQTHILWSSGDTVHAMAGTVRSEELFEMAQSMQ